MTYDASSCHFVPYFSIGITYSVKIMLPMDQPTNGWADGPTDGRTSYLQEMMHLNKDEARDVFLPVIEIEQLDLKN